MKFLTIFATLLLLSLTSAQTPTADPVEFFAQVVRYLGDANNPSRNRIAAGALINWNHVVTVASAVHNIPQTELRVYLESAQSVTSTDIRTVEHVFIHDNFVATAPHANNVAVLRLPYSQLDAVRIVPRGISGLTAVQCTVYNFAALSETVLSSQVTVRTTGCRANVQFCANFPTPLYQCGGFVGSPVICGNAANIVGISIDDGECTPSAGGLTATISLANIEPFADWIWQVSSAKITAQVSLMMMILGVVLGKILA